MKLSIKKINNISIASRYISLILLLSTMTYCLYAINTNSNKDTSNKLNNSIVVNKNNNEFENLINEMYQLNERIDNLYLWAIVFATLIIGIGFYQISSSRKIAEEIAKSEMFDMRKEIVDFEIELKNIQQNIARINAERGFNKSNKES